MRIIGKSAHNIVTKYTVMADIVISMSTTSLNTFFLCVQVLSSHLMHSSLPGLTRLEQMFLVALADTVATTSAEVTSSTDQKCTGQHIYISAYRLLSHYGYSCYYNVE